MKQLLVRLFCAALLAFVATGAGAQSCESDRWYCAPALNPGLPKAPATIDRNTPRATIESLTFIAGSDDWQNGAHLLDLGAIDPTLQQTAGADLIRQFETVIARKTVINWDDIPDRPDGMIVRAPAENRVAGTPRKSILLWTLDLDRHPVAIRLNRVKPADGDAVWVFAPQTVANIPALYDRYGPTRWESLIPDALKQDASFGLLWWEIITLPILLILSLLLGRLVWRGIQRLARHTDKPVVHEIINRGRGPAAVGSAMGFALLMGSQIFVFSGQITTVLRPIAWIGLVGAILWLVVNAVEAVLDRLVQLEGTDLTQRQEAHTRTVATRVAAARRAFVVAIITVTSGIFLSQTNLFANLGLTLLGTAGAVTLALAFAARRLLANIMASLQIALNGSARIGDRIVYKDYLCHVERINFTYVQLRDWDGTRLVVPVEEFVSTSFENWTMKEPAMSRIIKIKCAHTADVDALRDIFDDVVKDLDQDELGDLDDMMVRVEGQDVFGKDVWFVLPCKDPNTSWSIACMAREKIIAAANDLTAQNGQAMFPDVQPAEAA